MNQLLLLSLQGALFNSHIGDASCFYMSFTISMTALINNKRGTVGVEKFPSRCYTHRKEYGQRALSWVHLSLRKHTRQLCVCTYGKDARVRRCRWRNARKISGVANMAFRAIKQLSLRIPPARIRCFYGAHEISFSRASSHTHSNQYVSSDTAFADD